MAHPVLTAHHAIAHPTPPALTVMPGLSRNRHYPTQLEFGPGASSAALPIDVGQTLGTAQPWRKMLLAAVGGHWEEASIGKRWIWPVAWWGQLYINCNKSNPLGLLPSAAHSGSC